MSVKYSELVEPRGEIINGEFQALPPPTPEHSRVQGVLRSERSLGGFDDDGNRPDGDGPGGWWIFTEINIRLGTETYRPDLAGWKRERLPNPTVASPIIVTPDWICEVISPGNEKHDRVTKKRVYAEHGVSWYWIVDTRLRTLEAFELVTQTTWQKVDKAKVSGQVKDDLFIEAHVQISHWLDIGAFDDTTIDARIRPFDIVALDVSRLFFPREMCEKRDK